MYLVLIAITLYCDWNLTQDKLESLQRIAANIVMDYAMNCDGEWKPSRKTVAPVCVKPANQIPNIFYCFALLDSSNSPDSTFPSMFASLFFERHCHILFIYFVICFVNHCSVFFFDVFLIPFTIPIQTPLRFLQYPQLPTVASISVLCS